MSEETLNYFLEIEDFFCSQRNAPLLLSPIDFEKVVEWYSANIPIEVVKKGIARYFEKIGKRKIPLRKIICLSFAEDMVLKSLEEYRISRIGQNSQVKIEVDDKKRKETFITYLKEKLIAFLNDRENLLKYEKSCKFISSVINIIDDLMKNEKLSLADLEAKLSPLDSELSRLLLSETSPFLIEEFKNEARSVLEKSKASYNPEIVKMIETKVITNRIFSSLKIPRLSILYFNE